MGSLPKTLLRKYIEQYAISFANPIDWTLEDKEINKILEHEIKALNNAEYTQVHAHFERIEIVAGCGIEALINASEIPEEMETELQGMENNYHRAMAIFLNKEAVFKVAEELLFIDFKAEGRSWQTRSIKMQNAPEDIMQEDADEFAFQVAKIIRRNFNNRGECCGEIYKRYSDGTMQISVYINDFSNNDIQVKDSELHNVDLKKAIVAAIVYDPQAKQICTVVEGGKDKHEKIRHVFAEVVLKQKIEFASAASVSFAVEKFSSRPAAPMLNTLPEHGIETVRVRKLEVFSNIPHKHIMTVDTMAQGKGSDIYTNRTICDGHGILHKKYSIFHVVLSFHFWPKKGSKNGRTIHISLKKDSSDLKHLKEDDRQMIESYLRSWEIIEAKEEEYENRHRWLIQLLETGEQLNHNDAELQGKQRWFQQFIKENALLHTGNVVNVLCQQCDVPHDILIDLTTFTGYCVRNGNITVPPENLKNYQASAQWIIESSRRSLGVSVTDKTKELVINHFWKIGHVRLGGKPRPLFLCRDIGQSMNAVIAGLKNPPEDPGIILLTSPHQNYPDVLAGHRTAMLSFCLSGPGNKNLISHEILERIWKGQPATGEALCYAPDFSSVTLNGEIHHFRGKQQEFVRYLIESYRKGQTLVKTADIMTAIGVDYTRRISNFFSKHRTWKRLIDHGTPRGYCRIRMH